MPSKWRYQPVYTDDDAGRSVTLCECHFDENDLLTAWTVDPAMPPSGETIRELQRDVTRMLADAWKWKPVAFARLRVGMTFKRTGVDVEDMLGAMERARKLGAGGNAE